MRRENATQSVGEGSSAHMSEKCPHYPLPKKGSLTGWCPGIQKPLTLLQEGVSVTYFGGLFFYHISDFGDELPNRLKEWLHFFGVCHIDAVIITFFPHHLKV